MTTWSAMKVGAFSTMCGRLTAFCIYLVIDVVHPQPPDGVLDWIVTDIALLFLAAPVAISLWLLVWLFIVFIPHCSAVWYAVLLTCCGGVVGWFLAYLFTSVGTIIRLIPRDPLWPSPINFGSLAGAAAFAVAYVLACRKSSNQSLQPTAGQSDV